MNRTLIVVLVGAGILFGIAEVLGTTWDIWWHAYYGRDTLFSPPHLLMLSGMGAGFLTGAVAWWKGRSMTDSTARRAAAIIAVCGASQVVAMVLDEGWHRIFGQDAFVWSPPHLLILAGASAQVAVLLALAIGLARRQAGWWAGAAMSGGVLLSAIFMLLAESLIARARTSTRFLEYHPHQTHPHVAPWLAVLLAPALAGFTLGLIYEAAGRGKRGAALMVGSTAVFTLLGWIPHWLLPANNASPQPPMLVIVGVAVMASLLVTFGERAALAGALLLGPVTWFFDWWLETHYAFGIWYGFPLLLAAGALGPVVTWPLGRRLARRLEPVTAAADAATQVRQTA